MRWDIEGIFGVKTYRFFPCRRPYNSIARKERRNPIRDSPARDIGILFKAYTIKPRLFEEEETAKERES
jgi:hypothetical protein